MWKFGVNNKEALDKISNLNERQLMKFYNERVVVDKLTHLEKRNAASKIAISECSSPSPAMDDNKMRRRLSVRVTSSNGASPQKLSPLQRSRSSSIEHGSKLIISPLVRSQHKKDLRAPDRSSPTISRKGSIVDQLTKGTNDDGGVPSRIRGNRPRSSSLQSSFTPKKPTRQRPPPESIAQRSNSLEATATLNQRMIQNTVKHLMVRPNSKISKMSERIDVISPPPSISIANASSTSTSSSSSSNQSYSSTSSRPPSPMRKKNLTTLNHSSAKPLKGKYKTEETNKEPLPNFDALTLDLETEIKEEVADNEDDSEDSNTTTEKITKKVRFVGVPAFQEDEDPIPTRKGWYKKPPVLYYPPISAQNSMLMKIRLRQEGTAFKTS